MLPNTEASREMYEKVGYRKTRPVSLNFSKKKQRLN